MSERPEPSYWPDIAADVDTDHPAWQLAEDLLLELPVAEKVLEWHRKELAREVEHAKGEQLGRIVGMLCDQTRATSPRIPKHVLENPSPQGVQACMDILLKPLRTLKANIAGLAFAAGLDELNGTRSQSEKARELNVTRSLISHYTTKWEDELKLKIYKFRKSESSRSVFSKSAKKTWEKRKN
jgi:hypothetical protein